MTVEATDPTNLSHYIQARDGVAVVVYTKPSCVQCDRTFKLLDKANIHYTKVDVSQDPPALAFVKETLGYTGAPVVYVSTIDGDLHWYGLRPDLIKEHVTERPDAA
jgi:glutaredoxin-like protein NrdH